MNSTIGLGAAHLNARKTTAMSTNPAPVAGASTNGRLPTDDELREIAASLRGLRFGSVSIVVLDGVIIQIDRTEKKRLRTRRETSEQAQS
jgi:hypothetical protein